MVRKPGLLRRDLRVRILGNRILAHRRAPHGRRRHLDDDFLGPRQQHFVGGDLDALEPELDEPIARAQRELAIAIGSGEVRFPGEHAMFVTNAVARRKGKEPALERGLGGGAVAGEPEDRRPRPVPGRDRDQRGDRKRDDDCYAHGSSRTVALAFRECEKIRQTPTPNLQIPRKSLRRDSVWELEVAELGIDTVLFTSSSGQPRDGRPEGRRYTPRLMISRAAFCPEPPVMPPPGCVPAPHRYRPAIGVRYWAQPRIGRIVKS